MYALGHPLRSCSGLSVSRPSAARDQALRPSKSCNHRGRRQETYQFAQAPATCRCEGLLAPTLALSSAASADTSEDSSRSSWRAEMESINMTLRNGFDRHGAPKLSYTLQAASPCCCCPYRRQGQGQFKIAHKFAMYRRAMPINSASARHADKFHLGAPCRLQTCHILRDSARSSNYVRESALRLRI